MASNNELKNFSKMMVDLLKLVLPKKLEFLTDIYIKNRKFLNYCFVCGVIGISVNMLVLYTFVSILPLWMANGIAIMSAMASNYYLTVGPLGFYFDLGKKEEKTPEV